MPDGLSRHWSRRGSRNPARPRPRRWPRPCVRCQSDASDRAALSRPSPASRASRSSSCDVACAGPSRESGQSYLGGGASACGSSSRATPTPATSASSSMLSQARAGPED
eukprot:7905240-Alexandrium_andersonii.AAC.1